MKKIIFYLIIPNLLFSQNWNQVNNFPFNGVHHPITFSYEKNAYVVSGSNTDNVYKYDKINDTWVQLSSFPGGDRGYAYGIAVGSKAYMGFGSTPNSTFPSDWWEFDLINETWSQKSSFPGNGRNHPAMVNVGNSIFVGCGSNTSNLGDWWEYNISNDSWIQRSNIPGNNRHHPFYFGIGNYAYVGFGHGSLPGPGSNLSTNSYIYNDFYRYDPSTSSWTQMSNFPSEARVAGTQFSFNGKGYVLSGDGDDHGPLDSGELWEYTPSNDTWTQLPSHPGDAIWAPGSFVIDCSVFFLLGQNNNTFPATFPLNIYTYKLSQDCGCTDPLAVNFSSIATIDDGSCCYKSGCTDPYALNFDSTACFDDNSCVEPIIGCTNQSASNFNPSANTLSAKGGELENTFGSGGFFNNDQHLIFNSSDICVIKSAKIYSESNNSIKFELRNSNGIVIDDTTLNVYSGEQRINLNFEVPVGSNFQLGVSPGSLSLSGLYRNNSNTSYPYNIGSVINITSSSATIPTGYYYFFYDIEVEIACLNTTSLGEFNSTNKELIKKIDFLGREISKNNFLIYIFNDGTVEKKIIIE